MTFSCSKQTTLARLFVNTTKAFNIFFFHLFSKLFSSLFWYDQDYESLSDEEEPVVVAAAVEEAQRFGCYKNVHQNHLVADIVDGGQALHFLPQNVIPCHHTSSSSDEFWLRGGYHNEEETVIVEDIPGSCLDEHLEPGQDLFKCASPITVKQKGEMKLSRDDKFLIFSPPEEETKDDNEPSGVSCTYRDSVVEDPFPSSYKVFSKYDEEMVLLDRISAQKLHETESFRSFQVEPRPISQRLLGRTTSKSKRPSEISNPYRELESAYVAQICLAWEILSWDYNNFRGKLALRRQQGIASDPGFPAQVSQQFQQFQVLLQRYIENEPCEYGKRPEIFARIKRNAAPKLLIVPQIQDYEEDEKQEAGSRIPSASFLIILENSIRTFMDFLKADKESCCQTMIATLFRRPKGGSVDPALIVVMKKTNRKKKLKVKKLQRAGKCIRRKKKVTKEEEMEMVMGLIDLKVVARVLRMWDLTRQQVRWCEEKMTKLTLSKVGHLHRDASPLFFPPPYHTD